jgi:hypothetical protein
MCDVAANKDLAVKEENSCSKTVQETSDHNQAESELSPGINYTLSACAGRWSYMNDEGSTYVIKGYRIGCEDPHKSKSRTYLPRLRFDVSNHDVCLGLLSDSSESFHLCSKRRTMSEKHVPNSQRGKSTHARMGRTSMHIRHFC